MDFKNTGAGACSEPSDTFRSDAAQHLQRLAPILLLAWVLLNWGWTTSFGFNNDDFVWIHGADLSASANRLHTLFVEPPMWMGVYFRPLVQLSFVLNNLAGGLQPFGYHLVNLSLHTANAFLVLQLAGFVFESPLLALVASLLFAAHPTTAKAVAWVSGRTELLCTFFYLAAVLMHLRRRLPWALVLFTLALCSKESASSLPLVVFAADILGLGPRARAWRNLAAYGSIAAAYCLLRAVLLAEFAHGFIGFSPIHPLRASTLGALLRSKLPLLGQYLLEPFPVHGEIRSGILLGLGLVLLVVWGRRAPYRTRRAVQFASAWTVLTLLPYTGWGLFAIWYVYLAIIGTALLFTAIGAGALAKVPAGRCRTVVGLACLAVWLSASALRLRANNEDERRVNAVTLDVLNGLKAVVPSPERRSLFVISGMEPLCYRGTFILGLSEAVRLWYGDGSLSARMGDATADMHEGPIVSLSWDSQTHSFRFPPQ